jgi:hypothetical protein
MAGTGRAAHYALTLTTAVQQLSSVFPAPTPTLAAGAYDIPGRAIILQPLGANTGIIYVGFDANLTTTLYAFRLEAPAATIPPAPFVLELSAELKLSDIFVKSSVSGDKLQIGIVGF